MHCMPFAIMLLILISSVCQAQPFYTGTYGSNPHCQSCHATDQFNYWNQTPHGGAYDNHPEVQWDATCLPCHTTGWDVAHANHGFDEYFAQHDTVGMMSLRNVQCESCHGPTDQIPHLASTVVDCHSEVCGQCHTGMGRPTYDQWQESPHVNEAPIMAQQVACARCHEALSAAYFHRTGTQLTTLPDHPVWQITCSACHATHARPVLDHQLYLSPDSTCRSCHNMENATVGEMPHAPQENMLLGIGAGAYEWPGYSYVNSCHECEVPGGCALCHMDTYNYSGADSLLTGHDFAPRLETCIVCHPFWIGPDSTFDLLGMESEIDSLVSALGSLLAIADTSLIEWDQAKFDYDFVVQDASRGVHNYFYARGLLISSYEGLSAVSSVRGGVETVPGDFRVRVYPNPFNAKATISFRLHQPEQVQLKITNIEGALVEQRSQYFAAGEQRLEFDGSKLVSGIYVYQLTSGSMTAMGKLLLLK